MEEKIKNLLDSPIVKNQLLGLQFADSFGLKESEIVNSMLKSGFISDQYKRHDKKVSTWYIEYSKKLLGNNFRIEWSMTASINKIHLESQRIFFHIDFCNFSSGGYFYLSKSNDVFTYHYFDLIQELKEEVMTQLRKITNHE